MRKAGNGLRDSPRCWFIHSERILTNLKWERTIFEGVYIRKRNNAIDGVILIWVDDILVCSGLTSALDILKELSAHIEIEIKGIPTRFVGIDINVTNTHIDISQRLYASMFSVKDCERIDNPIPLNVLKEEDTSNLLSSDESTLYRRFLGQYDLFTTYKT